MRIGRVVSFASLAAMGVVVPGLGAAFEAAPVAAKPSDGAAVAVSWLERVPLSAETTYVTINDWGAMREALGGSRVMSIKTDTASNRPVLSEMYRAAMDPGRLMTGLFQSFDGAIVDPMSVTVSLSAGSMSIIAGGFDSQSFLDTVAKADGAKRAKGKGSAIDLHAVSIVDLNRALIGTSVVAAPPDGSVVVTSGDDATPALLLAVAGGTKAKASLGSVPFLRELISAVGPFHSVVAGVGIISPSAGADLLVVSGADIDATKKKIEAARAAAPPTPLMCAVGTRVAKNKPLTSRTACRYVNAKDAEKARGAIEKILRDGRSIVSDKPYETLLTLRSATVKSSTLTTEVEFSKGSEPGQMLFIRDFPPLFG